MAEHKTRFTVWMDPEVLRAAKARALQDGITVSEVLAAAAKRDLIDANRQNTDAQILQAVERVFNLIQRIDRRRVYDQQVLKEMLGLLIRSFFNHTPAVPSKDREAAIFSGKTRFNRFLDMLAANLRSGESVLNDLPVQEQAPMTVSVPTHTEDSATQPPVVTPPSVTLITPPTPPLLIDPIAPVVAPTPPTESESVSPEAIEPATNQRPTQPPKPTPPRKLWGLFQ
jgi:hypothetical protein